MLVSVGLPGLMLLIGGNPVVVGPVIAIAIPQLVLPFPF